jgi:hypothetical protein
LVLPDNGPVDATLGGGPGARGERPLFGGAFPTRFFRFRGTEQPRAGVLDGHKAPGFHPARDHLVLGKGHLQSEVHFLGGRAAQGGLYFGFLNIIPKISWFFSFFKTSYSQIY